MCQSNKSDYKHNAIESEPLWRVEDPGPISQQGYTFVAGFIPFVSVIVNVCLSGFIHSLRFELAYASSKCPGYWRGSS